MVNYVENPEKCQVPSWPAGLLRALIRTVSARGAMLLKVLSRDVCAFRSGGVLSGPVPTITHSSIIALIAGLAASSHAFGQAVPEPPKADPAAERAPEVPPSQGVPELEAFEGRLVRKIELRQPLPPTKEDPKKVSFAPLDATLTQLVRNQLRLIEGAAYQQSLVSEDMSRVNRLGRFKDVSNRVDLMSDGSVVLTYTLLPQQIVTDVQPSGNTQFGDDDIRKAVEVFIGAPVDRFQLDRGCRRIEEIYREKGFYLAQVSVDEQVLSETGIVIFKIREGEKVKVTSIVFDGNNSFSNGLLKNQIETSEAWLLSKGKLEDVQLDQDAATLTKFYKNRGYLEARVGHRTIPSPNGKEAQVVFIVEEGMVYTMRDLRVQHASPDARSEDFIPEFTEAQLLALMPLKPGDIYSEQRLEGSIQAIEAAYGKLGYTDVYVQKRELRIPGSQQVDMLLMVNEGAPYRTGTVEVQGNVLTKKDVILRQIQVRPERPLDRSALEESKRRLEDLNIFAPRSVKITPQDPDPVNPDYRDVLVEIDETNTGSFEFGAALGSDSGVIARFGVTQRNFDIFDTPESWNEFWSGRAFRGAGQVFRINIAPGTRYQSYSLSLTDPYFMESDYSLSTAVYLDNADYSEYNETRFGVKASVGRRFGKRWMVSLPTRIEGIKLEDIPVDGPKDAYDVADQKFLTGIGLAARRSSLDSPFVPTQGSVFEAGIEQIGAAGGDFTFTSLRAEHRIYIPLSEDYLSRRTTLSLTTKMAYITGGNSSVPLYERLYMGGQSMRGFAFRTVSPKGIRNDNGEQGTSPVGGTFSFFFGPELRVPLYEDLLSGVAFIDTGTVTDGIGFSPYRVSVGVGLRVSIRQLSPAPLAFDFGFPIKKGPGDKKRLFTFNIDVPF